MESLPDWAASIIAVAVGLSPGLALLMARPIGRFLRRVLLQTPKWRLGPDASRCGKDRALQLHQGHAGRAELISTPKTRSCSLARRQRRKKGRSGQPPVRRVEGRGRQPVLLLGHLGVALVEPGIFDELD
jgi:hypothetical protein